jgi:integrase
LPVTPLILNAIKEALESRPDANMLWAACCTGFCGFMRGGEFTVPSVNAYDSTRHLPVSDVLVDSHTNLCMTAVRIKLSKTDQFGSGTTIYLGWTLNAICPLSAMLQYLAVRPAGDGPLFVTDRGAPLTKSTFMAKITECLGQTGIDASRYKGHSFRIGAATTAAACGLNEGLIKSLGRWTSAAYQVYSRIPPTDLANVSAVRVRDAVH